MSLNNKPFVLARAAHSRLHPIDMVEHSFEAFRAQASHKALRWGIPSSFLEPWGGYIAKSLSTQ